MIGNILELLKHTESRSKIVAQAKGINKLPSSIKDIKNYIALKYKVNE